MQENILLIEKFFDETNTKTIDENHSLLEKEDCKEHLCMYCANGYTSKCSKIADLKKGPFSQYPFIARGYQIVKDEDVIKFIVLDCRKFRPVLEPTPEEKKEMNKRMIRLINAIFIDYYDAETFDEACEAREHLREIGEELPVLPQEYQWLMKKKKEERAKRRTFVL